MSALTFGEARHLVARTGLGAEWDAIKRLEGRTREEAVEMVLNPPNSPLRPPPAMTPWFRLEPMRLADPQNRNTAWNIAQQEGKRLQAWWLEQMLTTNAPFTERMTLFWHNHFTSSIQKTLQPSLLYKQNLLLRKHALGSFNTLLHEVVKDPAMLVYLDCYQNVKDRPNENLARELLELFALGRGYYSEADVKTVARALTGYGVDDQTGRFIERKEQHDTDRMTCLGNTGCFTGGDIVDMLLKHPRTAEHIAEKVWAGFVSSSRPNPTYTKAWAQTFRQSGYEIKALMRAMLTSEAFWSPANRGALVKSPVDIVVGTLRMLPYPKPPTTELLNLCRLLGQELFDPPNVKGWAGGEHWISTQTLLVRTSYLTKLSRGSLNEQDNSGGLRLPTATEADLIAWMLPVQPLQPLPTTPGAKRLVRALLLDPAFQVA